MTCAVLCSYLLGWVITTIGIAPIIRKLNHPDRPQPHPMALTVTAGAAWPLVVLGAAEMATISLVMKAARRRPSRRSMTRQVDAMLDDRLNV
jgi:hypothetical protein